MKILGLDVGEKRIGVAKADSTTRIAIPVETIEVSGNELERIKQLAKVNNTDLFVVGLPRSNEGNETAQTTFVRNFAKKLKKAMPEAKIKFQDESLTSVVAEDRLKKRKKGFKKGEIDAEAATVILQDFLESLGGENGKKKSKKLLTIIMSAIIAVVLITSAVIGVILIKQHNARVRAEEYAKLEAEMKAEVFNFTILPGETTMSVKKKLLDLGYDATEINLAMQPSNYDYAFLSGLDSLEGYLFGETIEFYKNTEVAKILDRFLAEMEKVITENNLEARYNAHGLSLHEGIILASIVQKEASSPEQPSVARVFLNRMNYGMTLGSDVTIVYALDLIDPERNVYVDNSLALELDSCYNTRIQAGLPCGAISNPGISALLAVAEPDDNDYLFFLTGDDGMMYYSYTSSEHAQNAWLHCQELCNISL